MKYLVLGTFTMSLLALVSCSVFGVRSEYQQVSYKKVSTVGKIEIREYPSRVVVEVSEVKERNQAFYSLFNYISGENISSQKISMTAPVQINEKYSEKISMTAPVEIKEGSEKEGMMMRFFLPATYTLESAPKPTNSQLTVKELPAQTFAVLRYSGSTSQEKFLEKKEELIAALAASPWIAIGPVSFLGYDPPFTIPFLKRNEVIVPVEKATSTVAE